jgi:transposase
MKNCPSQQLIADSNCVSRHQVLRVWKAVTKTGKWNEKAAYALQWGRGRKRKPHGLTGPLVDHITHETVLHLQASYSLEERALALNKLTGLKLRSWHIRRAFKVRGLSLKKTRRYPGPAKILPEH